VGSRHGTPGERDGEIERKFEVAAAGEVASLDPSTVLGGVVPAEPHERLLEAVYNDTPICGCCSRG